MRILTPTQTNLEEAASVLRSGGLVVIPTETVYGLAGAITQPRAIAAIFSAKGRPGSNPLIVHVGNLAQLESLVTQISMIAQKAIDAFWPGPLTLVLPKSQLVSDEITAGGSTVAVRMPSHPIALELLRLTDLPIAAPSANRFTRLSPTRATDVSADLGPEVDIVVDGGECQIGLESTVIDCTGALPVILRFGQISRARIEETLGRLGEQADFSRSPGQHPKHYSPRTPLRIVGRLGREEAGLTFGTPQNSEQMNMPSDPEGYGAILYALLHELDRREVSEILVEAPPQGMEWMAIWDRLTRASAS